MVSAGLTGCASESPGDREGPGLRIGQDGYGPAVFSSIDGITADPTVCEPPLVSGYPYHIYGGGVLGVTIDAKDPSGVEQIQALVAGHHQVTDVGSASVELGTYQSPAGSLPGTYVMLNFGAEAPPQVIGPLILGNLSFRINPSGDDDLTFFITASDSAGNDTHQAFRFRGACPDGSRPRQ